VRLPTTLSASERAAIEAFVPAVRALLGPEFREARLFGSRARGEGHEHSDLDIAVIVGPGGRARRHAVYDLAFDVGLAHGVDVAPLVMEEATLERLRERERMIARDLDAEGIPL
jgi:predicted nucleotidyltransferase